MHFWFVLACLPARARGPEFLPEVDAHLKLNSSFRAYLEAKDDRDGGDPHQFAIGPSVQLYVKPLIKLKNVTTFDLDDTRSRFLVLETGYRYITAPCAVPENRMLTAVTFNLPVGAGIRLSDRNRAALVLRAGPWAVTFDNYPLQRGMPTLPRLLVCGGAKGGLGE